MRMKRETGKMDILWIVGFLAIWLLLQLWILPKLGVPT
jgi:hypothetical protein